MRRLAFVRRLNRTVSFAATLLIIMTATCIQPSFGTFPWYKLTGSTPDRPGISLQLVSEYAWIMHIAVRGMNDRIYYSTFASSTVQSSWSTVGGSTPSGPAASYAYFASSGLVWVFFAVRGMDDGIYWKILGAVSWQKLSGSTPSGPAMSVILPPSGYIYMYFLVRGKDNGIYWCQVQLTPTYTQGPWHKLTGLTKDSPSFFLNAGYMYVAVRGMDDGIYWCTVNLTTFTQSAWHKIAGSTPSGPAIAYHDSFSFTVAVRGSSGDHIYYEYVDILDNYQHGWNSIPGKTPSGPAMHDTGATVSLFVRGTDNGIYCAGV